MNIVYIANANIPSSSANSINIMKMCEALADLDNKVTLLLPEFQDAEKCVSPYEYYSVKDNFKIEKVFKYKKNHFIYNYSYAIIVVLKAMTLRPHCVITRNPLVAHIISRLGIKTLLDLHGDIKYFSNKLARKYKKNDKHQKCRNIKYVAVTNTLKNHYIKEYLIKEEDIITLPNGINEDSFSHIEQKPILTEEKLNVGYVGSFFPGKGVELIAELVKLDKKNIYNLYGANEKQLEEWKEAFNGENVNLHGFIPYWQVPAVLNSQDVLLLPNQKNVLVKGEDIGNITSPLKLFEYMASEKVIIASNIECICEIINDRNGYVVQADDAVEWKATLDEIAENREDAKKRAKQAAIDVKQYTWRQRAKKMLLFIG